MGPETGKLGNMTPQKNAHTCAYMCFFGEVYATCSKGGTKKVCNVDVSTVFAPPLLIQFFFQIFLGKSKFLFGGVAGGWRDYSGHLLFSEGRGNYSGRGGVFFGEGGGLRLC
jgi:hypothetical protein